LERDGVVPGRTVDPGGDLVEAVLAEDDEPAGAALADFPNV
jgi:hypothetical protein